jgi:hypothetical protein
MNDSSTGAMQNHVKRFHPELLPEGVGPERLRARAPADDGSALPANPEAARDYALGVVLGDMQPINSVARAGLSSFLAKHAKVSLTRAPLSARQPARLSLGPLPPVCRERRESRSTCARRFRLGRARVQLGSR